MNKRRKLKVQKKEKRKNNEERSKLICTCEWFMCDNCNFFYLGKRFDFVFGVLTEALMRETNMEWAEM